MSVSKFYILIDRHYKSILALFVVFWIKIDLMRLKISISSPFLLYFNRKMRFILRGPSISDL
jgi:hypothetical protein